MRTPLYLNGNPVHLATPPLEIGALAPDFKLTSVTLQETTLTDYKTPYKIICTFPSVDTGTCATAFKTFSQLISTLKHASLLCISKDLPFAFKRFCISENIENITPLSAFNSPFAQDYGVEISNAPLKGLCTRAVIILDKSNRVCYSQYVEEISNAPNYDDITTFMATQLA
jgi:thiol peroxidase